MKINCWFYRVARRFIDEQASSSAMAVAHRKSCPACQQNHADENRLSAALRQSSEASLSTPSPFLHQKIILALDRGVAPPETSRSFYELMRSFALPAFAILMVSGVLFWNITRPHQTPSRQDFVQATDDNEQTDNDMAPINSERLIEWAANLDKPLEQEIYLVANDAKSALASLGDNFFPQALLARKDF